MQRPRNGHQGRGGRTGGHVNFVWAQHCCGQEMRALAFDAFPRDLERLICGRCGSRRWYHSGSEITDDQALTFIGDHRECRSRDSAPQVA